MLKLVNICRNVMLIQVLFASSICLAKTGPEIQFLNTYDQLTSVIGQEGHWFVRNAANTGTGQHGDPTVQRGWAIYTWDAHIPGWRKICEEESLDNSVSEALLRQYVKTSTFDQAMRDIAQKYVSLAQHNSDVQTLNNSIRQNTSSISALNTDLTKTKSNLAIVGQNADYAKSETVRIREMVESLDIDKVKQIIDGVVEKVSTFETKVGGIDLKIDTILTETNAFDLAKNANSNSIAYFSTHPKSTFDPSDPAFSNAVLAVQMGLSTDDVAALMKLANIPLVGSAGGIGAILLSLIAVVAALVRIVTSYVPKGSVTVTGTVDSSGVLHATASFKGEPMLLFGGMGTELLPYKIGTVEDLQLLDSYVRSGNTFVGKYFKQTADIDMDGVENWDGIGGTTGEFSGTYDGDGHRVFNIKTNMTDKYGGSMFWFLRDATVKNLTVHTKETSTAGGHSGFAGRSSGGTIINCVVEGTIRGEHHCGGFTTFGSFGTSATTFVDCVNYADISSPKGASGICNKPQSGAVIIRCINHGSIGSDCVLGDCEGFSAFSNYASIPITDCVNYGTMWCNEKATLAAQLRGIGTVSGTNKVRTDIVTSYGTLTNANFADLSTVDNNIITLVPDDQIKGDNSYKVMSKIPQYEISLEIGKYIIFDKSLNIEFTPSFVIPEGSHIEEETIGENVIKYTCAG